ncbi:antichymotrypsin-2-like [Pararge aegeria]|uniref:antichymotrypsin-2-like n=1 Tax=Pararge aegeria TaxID=116150 RepID=UPI0019D24B96|nr:antichymotrypsin-2-like [Pararge aegeria]
MKILYFLFLFIVTAMATGDEKQLETLFYDGNNKFTARMSNEIAKTNPEKSFVLSAYSVMTPLAQLALGSQGDSHDELLEAIGMPTDNATKAAFSLVNSKERSPKGATLKMASKVYVANSYELNSEFAEDTRKTFGSEIESMNFLDSENAANEINTWVEEQTNNRIKDLVDPSNLNGDTRALLVNAIYFKGTWKKQFEKMLTLESNFYLNKDVTNKVPMMFIKGDYNYAESHELDSQIVEIPYEGDESSMVIVLPRNMQRMNDVQKTLEDPNALEKALKNMYMTEVELKMPKFKIETTTDLKETLIKMNIEKMFKPTTAGLDKFLKGVSDLFISSAKQKAFIEVNEEGAEAAAANVFELAYTTSVGFVPQVVKFTADHPFFFFIRAGQYTLFNGVYYSS